MAPEETKPPPDSEGVEAHSRPRIQIADLLAFIPIGPGLVFLAFLFQSLSPHIHFSGDGALKEHVMARWIAERNVSMNVSDVQAPEWIEALWADGRFPFAEPFLFDGRVVFPPHFMLLCLPAYALMGYYGLFLWPLIGLIGLWIVTVMLLRAQAIRGWPSLVAMTVLVASPLTFYGAMFWEHTTGLFFIVVALWSIGNVERERAWRFMTGLLLAAAVAMRPELLPAALVIFVYGLMRSREKKSMIPGLAVGIFIWAAINLISTGHLFGIHARQPGYLSGGGASEKLGSYYATLGLDWIVEAPAATAALLLGAGSLLRWRKRLRDRLLPMLIVLSTILTLPFIIPNLGGLQIFRRYELIMIVAGALVAGRLARYRWWLGALVLLIALADIGTLADMTRDYRLIYDIRVRPVYEALESRRPKVLIIDDSTVGVELAPLFPDTPIVRARSAADLAFLIAETEKHVDLGAAALAAFIPNLIENELVEFIPGGRGSFRIALPGGGVALARRRDTGEGRFALFDLERVAPDEGGAPSEHRGQDSQD